MEGALMLFCQPNCASFAIGDIVKAGGIVGEITFFYVNTTKRLSVVCMTDSGPRTFSVDEIEHAYKVGDSVAWSSQASGSTTEKVGVIISVIPSGTRPGDALKNIKEDDYNIRLVPVDGQPRKITSYFVAVRAGSERQKPVIYWPIVKRLKGREDR